MNRRFTVGVARAAGLPTGGTFFVDQHRVKRNPPHRLAGITGWRVFSQSVSVRIDCESILRYAM